MFEDAAEVCRRGKTSDEFEARIVTADQNVIWAMFQFQIYTYRSAVPYYLVSCWDITERKKMENEIMLVNERYHMLEEVSDDIVLDYDVKKQQFEIPECYLKFAEDKSVKYAWNVKRILRKSPPADTILATEVSTAYSAP